MNVWLEATWFIDADDPRVVDVCRGGGRGRTDPTEKAIRLFYAVRDGFRYDPYNIAHEPEAFRASSVVESASNWCVPKSVLLTAAARSQGHPGPPRLRRRPQPPDEREAEGADELGRVRLARLQRAAPRRRLAQAEHGVQHRALRPLRREDARVRRHRRRPDAPVRQGRPPAHGVPPPARLVRRPPARRDHGHVRRDLRRGDDGRPPAEQRRGRRRRRLRDPSRAHSRPSTTRASSATRAARARGRRARLARSPRPARREEGGPT